MISIPLLTSFQAVADIIRTTLGPRSMLKMLLDASGGNFDPPFHQNYSTITLRMSACIFIYS